jgi:hypothetical protein
MQNMADLEPFIPGRWPSGFVYSVTVTKPFTLEEVVDEFGDKLATDDYERLCPGFRQLCSSKAVNACKLKLWKDTNGGKTKFKGGDKVHIPGVVEAAKKHMRQQFLERHVPLLVEKYACTQEYARALLNI